MEINLPLLINEIHNNVYDSIPYKLKNIHRDPKDKNYYYIPSDCFDITELFKDICKNNKDLSKLSFMDIGAGLNTIPKIAKILGFKESKGLEIDPLYVKLDYNNFLIQGDILKYDFKDYDILYAYNPIKDHGTMLKGLKNIVKTMKPGATLYFNSASSQVDDYFFNTLSLKRNHKFWIYTKPLNNVRKIKTITEKPNIIEDGR